MKPNPNEAFILYFSQSSYLFSLCQSLFILHISILNLFLIKPTNVLYFIPLLVNNQLNLNYISPSGRRYMDLSTVLLVRFGTFANM